MRKSIIFFLAFVLVIPLTGQTVHPQISFKTTEFDFGKINEEKGKVTHSFDLVNTGGEVLMIQNVTASCGCTAPSWTKEPILPGGTGFVSVTYDPTGRPGAFRKYVMVYSNSNPGTVRLSISGEVIPKPRTIEDEYRYGMGPLRLKSNHLAFANIRNTGKSEKSMEVVNNSDEPITIEFIRIPLHIDIKAEPSTLKPKQKGLIVATYDAAAKNDYGFLIDRLNISVNGQSDRAYSMVISANIEEDFSGLSPEELANAPVVSIDNPEFKFGSLNQGERVEHDFILKNSGKSDLIIRKVKASCGCTAVNPEKSVIGPGESIAIKTVFNSAGKVGTQNKTVTIITNDPKNSKLILWVKGEVIRR
ncbi:MAG: DUF1573 domain-containing protein [Bacteroidales bacterium]|nr:DUF1573 domain-containing protein [Bacteroidales bacterium]MBN2699006.1 DUF1573 domain-containing protein [Bacteroidales bacterium]